MLDNIQAMRGIRIVMGFSPGLARPSAFSPIQFIESRAAHAAVNKVMSSPGDAPPDEIRAFMSVDEVRELSKIDDVETFEYLETAKVFTSVENISFDEQLKLIASTYKMYNKANYNKLISNYTDNDRKVKSKFRQKRN